MRVSFAETAAIRISLQKESSINQGIRLMPSAVEAYSKAITSLCVTCLKGKQAVNIFSKLKYFIFGSLDPVNSFFDNKNE